MSRFVLVHGAWSDSAAWDTVAARLRSAGHQVAAPDLPAYGGDSAPVPRAGLDGRLQPEPLAPLATPVTVTGQRWGRVRRSYVHTTADRAVREVHQ
jgi:pimeloyl-ACP methyl ester carboxylesterase